MASETPRGETRDGGTARLDAVRLGELAETLDFVFWGFGGEALRRLAERAGFAAFELHAAPIIDGRPRIIASLADHAAANNVHRCSG